MSLLTYSARFQCPSIPKSYAAIALTSANPTFIHFKIKAPTYPENTFDFRLTKVRKLILRVPTF